jgi:ribosomal protein L15
MVEEGRLGCGGHRGAGGDGGKGDDATKMKARDDDTTIQGQLPLVITTD